MILVLIFKLRLGSTTTYDKLRFTSISGAYSQGYYGYSALLISAFLGTRKVAATSHYRAHHLMISLSHSSPFLQSFRCENVLNLLHLGSTYGGPLPFRIRSSPLLSSIALPRNVWRCWSLSTIRRTVKIPNGSIFHFLVILHPNFIINEP